MADAAANLARWLNKDYLDRLFLHNIAKAYQGNTALPSVQLRSFLDKRMARKLRQDAARARRRIDSVPDMHIYERLASRGSMRALERFIRSKEFAALVSFISGRPGKRGKALSCASVEWRAFGHGHYTLLHDPEAAMPGVYLFFDIADMDEACGGYTSAVRDGQELGRIVPYENSATFLTLGKARLFTKYVNHQAEKATRIVLVARFK